VTTSRRLDDLLARLDEVAHRVDQELQAQMVRGEAGPPDKDDGDDTNTHNR